MPVTQSERDLAGMLVHGGVGIGLVWCLDDSDATHIANPEENARTKRRLQAQLDEAYRTRAASSLRPRAPNGTASFPEHQRVLPAAD
jgi:hypothetical protein